MTQEEKKALLIKYAELKQAISKYEEEADALKEQVLEVVTELNPVDKAVDIVDIGTFKVSSRRSYSYPDSIKEAEAKLKQSKVEAEATGSAPYTESSFITFKAKKTNA